MRKGICWVLTVLLSLTGPGWTFAETSADRLAHKTKTVTPVRLEATREELSLTNDIAVAEAQAAAHPENPEAMFLLAVAYSRSPYLEKALDALKRTKKLVKKHPEGYTYLDRMQGVYEGMMSHRPNDPLVLYRLAFGYYMKAYALDHYIRNGTESAPDYYERAEKTMRRLVTLDDRDIWARNYLGFLVAERGAGKTSGPLKPEAAATLDRAISIWEDSLAISTENPGAYLLLGEAYLRKGNLKKAAQYAARGFQARSALGL